MRGKVAKRIRKELGIQGGIKLSDRTYLRSNKSGAIVCQELRDYRRIKKLHNRKEV